MHCPPSKVKRLNDIALHVHTSELLDVTCRMGSHSVTCHLTQVNASASEIIPLDISTIWTYSYRSAETEVQPTINQS